jgi:hypothetical protein
MLIYIYFFFKVNEEKVEASEAVAPAEAAPAPQEVRTTGVTGSMFCILPPLFIMFLKTE